MKVLRYKGFLCGHFTVVRYDGLLDYLRRSDWQAVELSADERDVSGNFYYRDFVDFSYGHLGAKGAVESTLRFRLPVSRQVEVAFGGDGRAVAVEVKEAMLYLMPFGLVQFSIEVGMEGVEYNDMVAALQLLRSNCDYKMDAVKDFVEAAILPVDRVRRGAFGQASVSDTPTASYASLTANGNKLKLFQIMEMEGVDPDINDTVLYNAGCLVPMTESVRPQGGSYYERTMEAGRVAVFDGWSALALFDSFTMLSLPMPDFRRDIWAKDYFGMIYIYALYRQAFIYHYSGLFRARECDIVKLESDILLFERRYRFERFSYNFLPMEIGRAMERALELEEGSLSLRSMVTQASAVYDKESDSRMNTVMTGLTLITLCSTVWDLFSLLEVAIVPSNGASFFRLAVGILVLALAVLAMVLMRRRKR